MDFTIVQDLPNQEVPHIAFGTSEGRQQEDFLASEYSPSSELLEKAAGKSTNIYTPALHQATSSSFSTTLTDTVDTQPSENPTSWFSNLRSQVGAKWRGLLHSRTATYDAENTVKSSKSLTVTNPMAVAADTVEGEFDDLQLGLFERAPQKQDNSALLPAPVPPEGPAKMATSRTSLVQPQPAPIPQTYWKESAQESGIQPVRHEQPKQNVHDGQSPTSSATPQPAAQWGPPTGVIVEQLSTSSAGGLPASPDMHPGTSPNGGLLNSTEAKLTTKAACEPPAIKHKRREDVDIKDLTDENKDLCQNTDTTETGKLIESSIESSPKKPCRDTRLKRTKSEWFINTQNQLQAKWKRLAQKTKSATHVAKNTLQSTKGITVTNPMAVMDDVDNQDLADPQLGSFNAASQMQDNSTLSPVPVPPDELAMMAQSLTSDARPQPVIMLQMHWKELDREARLQSQKCAQPHQNVRVEPSPTSPAAPCEPLDIIVGQPNTSPVGEQKADLHAQPPTIPDSPDGHPPASPVVAPLVAASPVAAPLVAASPVAAPLVAASPVVAPLVAASPVAAPLVAASPVAAPLVAARPHEYPPFNPVGAPLVAASPVVAPLVAASPVVAPLVAARPHEYPPFNPVGVPLVAASPDGQPPTSPDGQPPTSPDGQPPDSPDGLPPANQTEEEPTSNPSAVTQKLKEEVYIEDLTDDDIMICLNIDTTEADKLIESGEDASPDTPCCDAVFASCSCLQGGFSRFLSGQDQNSKFTPLLKTAAKRGVGFFMRYISPLQTKYLIGTLIYKLITLIILLVLFITSWHRLANRVSQSKSFGYDIGIALVSTVTFVLDLYDIIQSIVTHRHNLKALVVDLVCWCKKRCHSNASQDGANQSQVNNSQSNSKQQSAEQSNTEKTWLGRMWALFTKYLEVIILIVTEVLLYTEIILTLFAFICDETFKSISDNADSFTETLHSWLAFIFLVYIFRPAVLAFNVLVVREAIQRQNKRLKNRGSNQCCPSWLDRVFNFQVWLIINIIGQSFFHAFLLICIGWKIAQENCHLPPSAQSMQDLRCTRPEHFSFFTFYNVLFGIAGPWLSFAAFLFANVSWSKEFYIKLYLDCLLKSAAIASATKDELKSLMKQKVATQVKKLLNKMIEDTDSFQEEEEEIQVGREFFKPADSYLQDREEGRYKHKASRLLNVFTKTQSHLADYASVNPVLKGLHSAAFGPTALFCMLYFVAFILHIAFLACRLDAAGQTVCSQFELSVFGTSTSGSEYSTLAFLSIVFFDIANLQSFAIGLAYSIVFTIIVVIILLIIAISVMACLCSMTGSSSNQRRYH